jgi:hypothetical protein
MSLLFAPLRLQAVNLHGGQVTIPTPLYGHKFTFLLLQCTSLVMALNSGSGVAGIRGIADLSRSAPKRHNCPPAASLAGS